MNQSEYASCLVPGGTAHIPSIFMFKGPAELFSFLWDARDNECIVVFDNEGITVTPNKNLGQTALVSLYAMVAADPKIVHDYMKYLYNLHKMEWPSKGSK